MAFGPHPRSYKQKLNKKTSRLAFDRVLSEKIVSGHVRIVDGMTLQEAKTKVFLSLMKALGVKAPALFVMDKVEKNMVLAARNVENVEVVRASDVNVYQLLRHPEIVVDKAAMELMKTRLESA